MRFSTVHYRLLGSAVVVAGLGLAYVGCVSSDNKTSAGNNGASGATAGTGSGVGGGTAGNASGPCASGAVACPKPSQALITDFATPEAGLSDAGDITFGDFGPDSFSGGTFIYPTTTLTSDMSGGHWHISGTVSDYSGMGLFFNKCALLDAAAYKGISFTISGTINSPTANTLNMGISIAANTVANSWFVQYDAGTVDPNCGSCVPKSNNQYDGTCLDPQTSFVITSTPSTVTLLWADFTGGKPTPNIDPTTITHIAWFFPWTGAGAAPYAVDITIDDLKFVE